MSGDDGLTFMVFLDGRRYRIDEVRVRGFFVGDITKPVYADVYIMLDRSPSMVVGESMQDIMRDAQHDHRGESTCAFACHRNENDKTDPYLRVKASKKVRMKLDAAIDAIASFANTAKPEYHRIAVYGITITGAGHVRLLLF